VDREIRNKIENPLAREKELFTQNQYVSAEKKNKHQNQCLMDEVM
jgi:hypothetical protein